MIIYDMQEASRQVIHIAEKIKREIFAAAEAAYPEECCGLLLGKVSGQERSILRAIVTVNAARQSRQSRYEIDPLAYIAADKEAADAGLEVIGVFHSHPDHPARPSQADRNEAWEGLTYIIVSVHGGSAREMAAFELAGAQFAPAPLSVSP